MKQKIKIIIWFLIIFILFLSINSFLFWKKITNINQNKAIFNIISEININLENSLDIKLKSETYKNIENTKIIWKWFFINKNWEFYTANHLFENKNSKYYIEINNKKYKFKIYKVALEPWKDIVFWKIMNFKNKYYLNTKFKKHDYMIYNNLEVFIIKNNKKTLWNIISLNNNIEELKLNNLIKTNIKLSPWDSWSPIFNKNTWTVIWINIAIKKWENISFFEKL